MKKNLFMVAAVALMAMVSCNKEEINNGVQEAAISDIVFEAETSQTKTTLGEADADGVRTVSWVVDDAITINGSTFTAKELKGNKAIFVTTNTGFAPAETYDAIYPAAAGTSLNAVTISAEQDGTFAKASISENPIGPFQIIVLYSLIASAKALAESGPISSPSHPSGISFDGVTFVSAPSLISSAQTLSVGK